MTKLSYIIGVILLVVVIGGVAFLATWEIPAPSKVVEKEVPDDRFPR